MEDPATGTPAGADRVSLPLATAIPPDLSVETWHRFFLTYETYEYTGWMDESLSWKTDCFIGDWSPLFKLRVKGSGAQAFFEHIATNHWPNFKPGQGKHAIFCQENGNIVGEGIVIMLDTDDFMLTSGPAIPWAVYQFQSGRNKFDATLEMVTDDWFLLQVQGPKSPQLMESLAGGVIRDIKFMHYKEVTIEGVKCLCLRQGISGELGFELWGPMPEARNVWRTILARGQDYGIRQLGGRTKMVNHVEAAFATPTVDFIIAVQGEFPQLASYREFLKGMGFDVEGYFSRASGSYGTDPFLHHRTPFDLGWDRLVNFDHDFIGKEALSRVAADPPNKLVTLVWNSDDVSDVFASLFRDETYEYMEMPRRMLGVVEASTVLNRNEEPVGCAVSRCYSYWFREMISLCIIKRPFATPGTEVVVKWGSDGKPQKLIRAVVHAAPYKEDRRRHPM